MSPPDTSCYARQQVSLPCRSMCRDILRKLPEWFGIESALENYAAETELYPTLGACDADGTLIGFITLRPDNEATNEIHVMAVHPSYHRRGIGRMLINAAIERSQQAGFRLLEVKTLGPSKPDPFYDRTRDFYLHMGFRPIKELIGVWDGNPCLVMVRVLFPVPSGMNPREGAFKEES